MTVDSYRTSGHFPFCEHAFWSKAKSTAETGLKCICVYNKLSLAGMQLPEKYKENFDVSSEGP
jgi:hypothetical protein